jgi:hypothetical protein
MLVDLFESYDDARTYESQILWKVLCIWFICFFLALITDSLISITVYVTYVYGYQNVCLESVYIIYVEVVMQT